MKNNYTATIDKVSMRKYRAIVTYTPTGTQRIVIVESLQYAREWVKDVIATADSSGNNFIWEHLPITQQMKPAND